MRWESPSSPVGKYPTIAYWEPRPASSPPRPSHGQFPGRPQEPPLSVLTPALPWGRVEGATSAGRSALSSGAQASLDRKHRAHPFPSCSPRRRAGVGSAERGAPWRQEAAHTRPPGGSGLIPPCSRSHPSVLRVLSAARPPGRPRPPRRLFRLHGCGCPQRRPERRSRLSSTGPGRALGPSPLHGSQQRSWASLNGNH